MKLIKILTLVTMFALASLAAGCGKKDKDKKKDPTAQKVKPGDVKKPAEPVKPPVADPTADEEAGLKVTEQLADVLDANKGDCAKLATELTKFYEANKDAVEKGKKFASSLTPESAAAFQLKYAERIAAYAPKMAAAAKCATDPAFAEAMKALTPEPPKAVAPPPAKDEPAKKAP